MKTNALQLYIKKMQFFGAGESGRREVYYGGSTIARDVQEKACLNSYVMRSQDREY